MINFFKSFKSYLQARFERDMLILEDESTRVRVNDKEIHNYDTIV